MKSPQLILVCCFAFSAYAGEKAPSTGDRLKSDAKGFAGSVAKATKDVGRQIGTGTKKAVKSIKTKTKTDINKSSRGNGSAKRQNKKMETEKSGRQ
jgi:hypothetical protein